MAPEVLRGVITEKCDIWACGILLYFILSGHLPFKVMVCNDICRVKIQNKLPKPFYEEISTSVVMNGKKFLLRGRALLRNYCNSIQVPP
jgi:serine/threonine protein kinase